MHLAGRDSGRVYKNSQVKGLLPSSPHHQQVTLIQFQKENLSYEFLYNRDFGCVIGLANIGGLCKNYGNVGWSKVTEFKSSE